MSDQNNSGSDRPGFLAGLFGVQSHANRERDFNKGNPGDYIGVYVILVLGLVIGVFVVVKMVLSAAGS